MTISSIANIASLQYSIRINPHGALALLLRSNSRQERLCTLRADRLLPRPDDVLVYAPAEEGGSATTLCDPSAASPSALPGYPTAALISTVDGTTAFDSPSQLNHRPYRPCITAKANAGGRIGTIQPETQESRAHAIVEEENATDQQEQTAKLQPV